MAVMQVRTTGGKKAAKLYLTPREYQQLRGNFVEALADKYSRVKDRDHKQKLLATRFCAETGVRSDGVLSIRHGGLRTHEFGGQTYWFYSISAKDTRDRDTEGKRRDVWVHQDLRDDLKSYIEERNITHGDKLFHCSYETLKQRHIKVGEWLAEQTGNPDWRHLRTHDFRRYFACTMARMDIDDRIAMWLGGWEDESQYHEYAQVVHKSEIIAELQRKGMVRNPIPEDYGDLSTEEAPESTDDNHYEEYECYMCHSRFKARKADLWGIGDKPTPSDLHCPFCVAPCMMNQP